MSVKFAHVVAADNNNVIGDQNRLLWRISDDLKHFKSVTTGKPVVMGRKTFQSIGFALPDRDNIVVSRDAHFRADGVFVVRSIDDALTLAARLAQFRGANECCMIGGAQIYEQTIGIVDRVYFTRVDADLSGDARYTCDLSGWTAQTLGNCEKSDKNQYACLFQLFERSKIRNNN